MQRTFSALVREAKAVYRKEYLSESRGRSALLTGWLLSFATVFLLAFAFYGRKLTSESAAGMLLAGIMFAGVGTLARAFIAEEEQGTGDLLRLIARPVPVFWGKALFAATQMAASTALLSLFYVVLTGVNVLDIALFATTLLGVACVLAALMTLLSALVSRGSNRSSLAGAIAIPLLIPMLALAVSAIRASFEGPGGQQGWSSCFGVWLYTFAVLVTAPHQFTALWGEP